MPPKLLHNFSDRTVLATGGAILSATVAQSLSSRWSEIGSEALCWTILSILFAVQQRVHLRRYTALPPHASDPPKAQRNGSSIASWLAATAVTLASCYKAEFGAVLLLPVLTPLLVAADGYFRPDSKPWGSGSAWWALPRLASTNWGSVLVAVVAIAAMCGGNFDISIAWSAAPTVALLLVYLGLTLGIVSLGGDPEERQLEGKTSGGRISFPTRAAVILWFAFVAQVAYYGPLSSKALMPALLLQGLNKALAWYFTSRAAHESSWCIAPAILTFAAISNAGLFTHPSEATVVLELLACLFALAQVIGMTARSSRGRWVLWCFLGLPLGRYLHQAYQIGQLSSGALTTSLHPVEILIQAARVEFQQLKGKQSRSFEAAHAEYQRRYGMEPPAGFEEWYSFAVENKSPIIDNFDAIYTSITPFFRLSGLELAQMMRDAHNSPESDVWLCTFNGTRKDTSCDHPYRDFDRNTALLFDTLSQNITTNIPDVSFLVNHLDEPRALIPPQSHQIETKRTHFQIEDLTNHPTFSTLIKYCPHNASQASTTEPRTLPFVTNLSSAMNLCHNPSYANQHGLFLSPTSFHLIEGLVPILSTGAPSTMGDILFPSPAYTVEDNFLYDASHGMEWEEKRNNLYWAGSTTGGYAADDSRWRDFHRQRFVALAQGKAAEYQYLREEGGVIKTVKSRFLNRRLFYVDFTRVFMCALRTCRDEKDYFGDKGWADKDAALGSKLVFDLDGNGISGRYYKFLASRSAVLKQTLFREWHDDRLVPWVHYIPVSQGMEELPELVLWLMSTSLGQTRAREVADQGRGWFERALRPVDRTIYLYRLLLELARLQDPARKAQ